MSYDPEFRRATPLALQLEHRIRRDGPISVRQYMDACLNDPVHGYYRTQRAIGQEGDFVTAPEISQAFGELIGLWAAVVWQQMGSPAQFNLVELGPGRGTLMADLLRATRGVPGFLGAARIALVEPNPVLVAAQKQRLGDHAAAARWYSDLSEIRPAPTILLANEVLDVVPVCQHLRLADGWREMGVGLDASGRLAFQVLPEPGAPRLPDQITDSAPGDVFEQRDCGAVVSGLQRLAGSGPVAALFIDYGHTGPAFGDTLQAVRSQHYEHPLTSPGEADITAHVDFSAFGTQARAAGFVCDGPVTQAEFLGSLGIVQRASRLMAANAAKAGTIEAGVARLMAPGGMGLRFKVLGVRSPGLGLLPGIPGVDKAVDAP